MGEGEWESKFWEGFVQARDYSVLPAAAGSFLIGYPERLRRTISQSRLGTVEPGLLLGEASYSVAFLRPERPTDLRRGLSLEELPEWLREMIYEVRPPVQDIGQVVSLLRQTVAVLNRELVSSGLRPALFRNLLSGDPLAGAERAAREAGGYLLINQIAFYRVLSHHHGYPLINPDALEDPSDLQGYFNGVRDYEVIFGYGVASEFGPRALPLLQKAVKAIYGLAPESISQGTLGTVFHELIPLQIRKPIAAYYTLGEAASLLAEVSVHDSELTVLDLAVGSGTLLTKSYER